MKINYLTIRKSILVIILGFLSFAAVAAVGTFLWVQTWKIYQFPDNQGFIKYPKTWNMSVDVIGNGISASLGDFKVIINRKYPARDITTAENDAKASIQKYTGAGFNEQFKLSEEIAYSKTRTETTDKYLAGQFIEVAHKGYVYNFQFYYLNKGILSLWEKFIYSLMIHTIYFNPTASSTTLHEPSY